MHARILQTIDARRVREGCPDIGAAVEAQILALHIDGLEEEVEKHGNNWDDALGLITGRLYGRLR